MKIGELSAATRTQVETIRFYEREGLIPPPARSDANYRLYAQEHVEDVSFIRQCRALDMTLDEIRGLLTFRRNPGGDCAGVNELLDEHIEHVTKRVSELQALERTLRELRDRCITVQSVESCGILAELSRSSSSYAAPASSVAHIHGVHRFTKPGQQE
jgi:Cd(II)/Pb(II)-responsive transcriptional regulator